MLSRTRPVAAVAHATRATRRWLPSHTRRACYSTGFAEPEANVPASEQAHLSRRQERYAKADPMGESLKTIFVRPWDGIWSMPEAFAIVRAIEKRYGRIREYKFIRDTDVIESYHVYFWADLRDKEAWLRVPPTGEVLEVRAPPVLPNVPGDGGVGLAELQSLLAFADYIENPGPRDLNNKNITEDQRRKLARQVIDVRVERAQYSTRFEPPLLERSPLPPRSKRIELARAFINFGGFSAVPPVKQGPDARPPLLLDDSTPVDFSTRRRLHHALTRGRDFLRHNDQVPAKYTPRIIGAEEVPEIREHAGGAPAHANAGRRPRMTAEAEQEAAQAQAPTADVPPVWVPLEEPPKAAAPLKKGPALNASSSSTTTGTSAAAEAQATRRPASKKRRDRLKAVAEGEVDMTRAPRNERKTEAPSLKERFFRLLGRW